MLLYFSHPSKLPYRAGNATIAALLHQPLAAISTGNRAVTAKLRLLFLFFSLTALIIGLAACSENALTDKTPDADATAAFKAEPVTNTGDAARGIAVFGRMPCLTCHSLSASAGSKAPAIGPALEHIGTNAATRVPGVTAAQYLRHAIVKPEDLAIPNYHNVMPSFGASLSQTDLDDLVAYLLTLK